MTTTTVAAISRSLQKTNEWLADLVIELDCTDREDAYKALRVVLHTLRDQLPVKEVTDLAAQMPTFIRGMYFEGWNPHHKPQHLKTVDDFVNAVDSQYPEYDSDDVYDPYATTRGVFAVLSNHISAGEIEDVIACLPKGLLEFWG